MSAMRVLVKRTRIADGRLTGETTLTSATITKVGRKWVYVVFEDGQRGIITRDQIVEG
jgi:hypothetical protein